MKNNLSKRVLRDRRGYTAIIALALSLVIMYFAMDVGRNIQTQGRNIQAFKDSSRAYFLADSFVRNLMSEGKGYDAGWNVEPGKCGFDPAEDFSASGQFINTDKLGAAFMESLYMTEGVTTLPLETVDEIKKIKIKCSVVGVTGQIAGEYVVPSPNTGDAGKDCGSITASAAMGDIDHSCNWGRLNFGNQYSSRVAVPLYYYEGDVAKNPDENGMNLLKIKVRTPCKPVEDTEGHRVFVTECENTERYELDDGTETDNPKQDETVVNWQITGECDGKYCALIPWMARLADTGDRIPDYSSEIYDSLIKNANDGVVLDINTDHGIDVDRGLTSSSATRMVDADELVVSDILIKNFLLGDGRWSELTITKPRLQLGLVAMKLWTDDKSNPQDDDYSDSIPYLEYQIISDVPISNNATKYMVEVQYNGQAYKIERSVPQSKDLVDFAIQN